MTEAENLIGESDHEKSEAKEEKPIYEKFKEYPYYDWNDESAYASFMLELLGYLEVRHFEPFETIYNSVENPEEFYFC